VESGGNGVRSFHRKSKVPDLTPMLAERGLPTESLDRWAAEPKLDGWRVTVSVADGRVAVRTPPGHDITGSVPGIEALAAGGHDLLLDGELMAGAEWPSDVYAPAPRLAGRSRRPATPVSFWAFDLLWLDGELLVDRPYLERRTTLEELPIARLCGVVPRFSGPDTDDLLAACAELDVEVVVFKQLTSRYHPGERRPCWRTVRVSIRAPRDTQRRGPW
jgi:bifunctional non-homologous end joining protein LigD